MSQAGRGAGGPLGAPLRLLLLALVVTLSCQSRAPEPPLPPPAEEDPLAFSSSQAWTHLQNIVGMGARVPDTRGSAQARRYIRSALEQVGAEVQDHARTVVGDDAEWQLHHLQGRLPGASPDTLLFVAHYDTHPTEGFRFVGANDGASGVALLLELARVFSQRPRPYTLEFWFLDGDSLPGWRGALGRLGSQALAQEMASQGRFEQIRLALFFNQVADPDLMLARDLRSHRVFREVFWQAAEQLELQAAFAGEGAFESPESAHVSFREEGLSRVVALIDNRFGGDEAPGLYWHTEDDTLAHVSEASLRSVGLVTLESVERITKTLDKIDRFVAAPLTEPAEELGPLPTPGREREPAAPAVDRAAGEPSPGAKSDSVPRPTNPATAPPAGNSSGSAG